MKASLLCLLVAFVVLIPTTNAMADEREDFARLSREVKELRATVAELAAQVADLRAQVRRLEALLQEVDEPADEPVEMFPPTEERRPSIFGPVASGAAGTYVLDREHFEKTVLEYAVKEAGSDLEELPEEQREEMLNMMKMMLKSQLESANLKAVLDSDGTFSVTGQMGDETIDTRGTWKQEGEELAFTATHENGEEMAQPETKKAVYRNNTIMIRPDEEMPFDLILLKK